MLFFCCAIAVAPWPLYCILYIIYYRLYYIYTNTSPHSWTAEKHQYSHLIKTYFTLRPRRHHCDNIIHYTSRWLDCRLTMQPITDALDGGRNNSDAIELKGGRLTYHWAHSWGITSNNRRRSVSENSGNGSIPPLPGNKKMAF